MIKNRHDGEPKVSQGSIFRNKYNPTVIRLNVEDDENVILLDDPEFGRTE